MAKVIGIFMLNTLLGSSIVLCMTPVYGSIPTSACYTNFRTLWALVYFSSSLMLTQRKLRSEALCTAICCLPLALHSCLFPLSTQLGPIVGPLVTQLATLHVLNISSSLVAMRVLLEPLRSASRLEKISKTGYYSKPMEWCLVGVLGFALHSVIIGAVVPLISQGFELQADAGYEFVTRTNLLQVLSSAYPMLWRGRLSKRQIMAWALVSVLTVTLLGFATPSRHNTTANKRLQHANYQILDSQDSNTGHISVVQNLENHFRVLRSDHSLLGGVWLPHRDNGLGQPESVYPVFHMLESVRLVECESYDSYHAKAKNSALVIGLGIGTAPAALSAHGIRTTVVEIDPVVMKFAKRYFGLPQNITYIRDDAIEYVAKAVAKDVKFDYIIHDVFTGGAEPIQLFTYEFLHDLHTLLSPQGSIAINYAGNLHHASTLSALQTICTILRRCRVFRDSPVEQGDEQSDASNLVVFAHASGERWKFREPVEADFLSSDMRRKMIPPQVEVNLGLLGKSAMDTGILKLNTVKEFATSQYVAACDHWRVMRKVMPAVVWETF